MSFRKKSIPLGQSASAARRTLATPASPGAAATPIKKPEPLPHTPGTRPSPIDGRPVTSTGTSSLDDLLAGHKGLPLGHSILVEEPGTTDFSSILLRYFAAEGVQQGHYVTVVGAGERWGAGLPGVMGVAEYEQEMATERAPKDKMKIAWRYERLGEHGSGIGGSRAQSVASNKDESINNPFCHTFDLTKRLEHPSTTPPITYLSPSPIHPAAPYAPILDALRRNLQSTPPHTLHRLIVPSFLSPLLYPPAACTTPHALRFFHSLRALLRTHPARLVIIASLPTALYPRDTPTVKWLESLSDVVVQLTPRNMDAGKSAGQPAEDVPQGVVSFWKMFEGERVPVEDLGFVQSRRRFRVVAWSLPPVEGEEGDGGHGHGHSHGEGAKDLEF